MKSAIEEKLTEKEKSVLSLYRIPDSKSTHKNIRLSVQYAVAAGLFSYLAVTVNPNFVWATFGTFVIWMLIRIVTSKNITGVMPSIIEKYEQEIENLKIKQKLQ